MNYVKKHLRKKIYILILFALCLSACTAQSSESCSPVVLQSSDGSQDVSSELNISARDVFVEKFAFDVDVLYCNIEDSFYELLLNNPIDSWRDSQSNTASFSEMLEIESRAYNNWIRECNSSVVYLCERYPNLSEDIIAEQSAWETYVNSYVENAEMMVYGMEINGALQWLNIAIKKTDLARQRAFHLAYLEYVSLLYDSSHATNAPSNEIDIIFS